jgi:hypothetical protein
MRVAATIFNQNYFDGDRYEAEKQGEAVATRHAVRVRGSLGMTERIL